MAKLDFNRVLRSTLAALTLALIGGLVIVLWRQSRTVHLTMAAGASSGESYILGNGLKAVLERHYPRIRITLLQTGGTVENLKMLEDGRAQLATAQSDIASGARAQVDLEENMGRGRHIDSSLIRGGWRLGFALDLRS
jgi:TRAP-type uncharacterized transport system substrate-binding protein